MSTLLMDRPRPPRSVHVDEDLRSDMVRAGLRASLGPRRVAVLSVSWALVGLALWLLSGRPVLGWAVGVGAPLVLVLRSVVLTVRGMRTVAQPGSTITSGYDEHSHLVLVRATGELVLPAGCATDVVHHGRFALIERRGRQRTLVTPRELLTAADVEYLTQAPATLPWSVVVTPEMQRELSRTLARRRMRDPVMVPFLALVATLMLLAMVLLPLEIALIYCTVLALSVGVGFGTAFLLGRRFLFPVGRTVHAGLDHDSFTTDWPRSPGRFRLSGLRGVERTEQALLLRGRLYTFVFPAALVPDEGFAQLQRAVGAM